MLKQLFPIYNQIIITESQSKGLFDFNATLPLMALQFLLLTFLLNITFYRPISKVLDEREGYIKSSLESASNKLQKAEKLSIQYEEKLGKARKEAQSLIQHSQQEAQSIVEEEIAQSRQEANHLIEKSTRQLNIQKEEALKKLENYVYALSEQIYNKLLSGQSVFE